MPSNPCARHSGCFASAPVGSACRHHVRNPSRARLASSFSRNGISEAATETSCFGRAIRFDLLHAGPQPYSRGLTRMTRSLTRIAIGIHALRCLATACGAFPRSPERIDQPSAVT